MYEVKGMGRCIKCGREVFSTYPVCFDCLIRGWPQIDYNRPKLTLVEDDGNGVKVYETLDKVLSR